MEKVDDEDKNDQDIKGFATLVIDNSKIIENQPQEPETPSTPEESPPITQTTIIPEAVTESVPEAVTESVPEAVPEAVTEAVPESVPEAVIEQTYETKSIPKPDINRLGKLMEETKRQITDKEEVDIDVISVSDMPKINKNSNSIKQQLNDSQNYSIASSRRQKKYSTFLFRN